MCCLISGDSLIVLGTPSKCNKSARTEAPPSFRMSRPSIRCTAEPFPLQSVYGDAPRRGASGLPVPLTPGKAKQRESSKEERAREREREREKW